MINKNLLFISILAMFSIPSTNASMDPSEIPANIRTLALASPVGDNTHTDIYGFLGQELLNHLSEKRDKAIEIAQIEKEILESTEILKPDKASIAESELSHILNALCLASPGCVTIALYARNGLAIGLTYNQGLDDAVIEDGELWTKLNDVNHASNPLLMPLDCPYAERLGLPCSKNYIVLIYRVYRIQTTNGPLITLSRGTYPDNKIEIIGFVRSIKDLNSLRVLVKS